MMEMIGREKRISRWILITVSVLMVILISTPVKAYPILDGRTSTLTERAIDPASGQPISDLSFSLYKVADMTSKPNTDVQFDVTPEFQVYDGKTEFHLDFTNWAEQTSWADGAKNVAPLVIADENGGKVFTKYTAKTGADGIASWTGIPQGLYLMIARYEGADYANVETQPVFLTLPKLTEDTASGKDPQGSANAKDLIWQHDVNADAKTVAAKEVEPVSLAVRKIWSGDDKAEQLADRPSSVEVTLYNTNGEAVDKVTLNSSNNWQYTWERLDGKQTWSVIETIRSKYYTPNYTQTKSEDGKLITWTVNNTFPKEVLGENRNQNKKKTEDAKGSARENNQAASDRLPQTGQLWWPIWILIGAAAVLIIAGIAFRRSGRKNRDD